MLNKRKIYKVYKKYLSLHNTHDIDTFKQNKNYIKEDISLHYL